MKLIFLSKGKFVKVDNEDYEYLNQWKWHYVSSGYAARTQYIPKYKSKMVLMHREIMKTRKGMEVDHIDHDKLNNQRYNLRNCVPINNKRNNVKRINNTSGYVGVCCDKKVKVKKYHSYIDIKGKRYFLGYYLTAEEAARVRDHEAKKHFGKFAQLNFP